VDPTDELLKLLRSSGALILELGLLPRDPSSPKGDHNRDE